MEVYSVVWKRRSCGVGKRNKIYHVSPKREKHFRSIEAVFCKRNINEFCGSHYSWYRSQSRTLSWRELWKLWNMFVTFKNVRILIFKITNLAAKPSIILAKFETTSSFEYIVLKFFALKWNDERSGWKKKWKQLLDVDENSLNVCILILYFRQIWRCLFNTM